jgi:hypothetical protein
MTTHRIDLQAPEKGYGKTLMSYLGEPIEASDSPIYSAARWLFTNGHASPDDTVATYRGETLCMSGKAGKVDGAGRGPAWLADGSLHAVCLRRRWRQIPAGRRPNPNSPVLSHDRARSRVRRIVPRARTTHLEGRKAVRDGNHPRQGRR